MTPTKTPLKRLPLPTLLLAAGGIYAAQGLIGGLTFQGLPTILRANNVGLDVIGLVFLAMLPWAFKFLWAPYVENWRRAAGRNGRTRQLVVSGELSSVLLLTCIAAIGFQTFWPLFLLLMLLALIASTVDIACDGFIIEQLDAPMRGWGNTAQMAGGYSGFILGTGVFLWLGALAGWTVAAATMALCVLLLTVPFMKLKEPAVYRETPDHRPSLRFALVRPEVRLGIVVMILYDLGIRITSGLEGPYLVDTGMSLATIGVVTGFGGMIAGIAGTFVAGAVVRFASAYRAVVIALGLQVVGVGAFFFMSATGKADPVLLTGVVLLKACVMGFGFVAIYSQLMDFSSLRQAGVDFTLFQCVDAAIAAVGGFGAGMVAQRFGYAATFGVAAGLSIFALIVVSALLARHSSPKAMEIPNA